MPILRANADGTSVFALDYRGRLSVDVRKIPCNPKVMGELEISLTAHLKSKETKFVAIDGSNPSTTEQMISRLLEVARNRKLVIHRHPSSIEVRRARL